MTVLQMETMTVDQVSMSPILLEEQATLGLVALDEGDLDLCSGGARNAGSSTSGFSRNRMAMTKGTFAGPEGAGSFQSVVTEEISSFAGETWDICQ
ncbi:MAG: hypothetical protein NW220_22770 [Leptolyngbyaceae cyanobacterium bins.349]|nr:hypothetical protein [Leptolyngbyaceae cyanobacterium bins.349]